ncbi:MAG: S46 family peptidase [Pirellula sp.]|nr:S46 family peptidase [Pirellula sp.]
MPLSNLKSSNLKSSKLIQRLSCAVAIAASLVPTAAHCDEGMWLFNALPKKQLASKYQFEPTQAWVDHVMLSSVRFNSGGSASFVSSNGLVLTNHHVAAHGSRRRLQSAPSDDGSNRKRIPR